jgi:hypothetical protein
VNKEQMELVIKQLKRTFEIDEEVGAISKQMQSIQRMNMLDKFNKIAKMKELLEESQSIRKNLIKTLEEDKNGTAIL